MTIQTPTAGETALEFTARDDVKVRVFVNHEHESIRCADDESFELLLGPVSLLRMSVTTPEERRKRVHAQALRRLVVMELSRSRGAARPLSRGWTWRLADGTPAIISVPGKISPVEGTSRRRPS